MHASLKIVFAVLMMVATGAVAAQAEGEKKEVLGQMSDKSAPLSKKKVSLEMKEDSDDEGFSSVSTSDTGTRTRDMATDKSAGDINLNTNRNGIPDTVSPRANVP